tara:strand:+ start:451 stop:621 length:171 start_codon:yes stop_codon:yes gene_type:complete
MKEFKTYEFYYYFIEGGKEYEVLRKVCKMPERTKIYKELLNSLDSGYIAIFGYRTI